MFDDNINPRQDVFAHLYMHDGLVHDTSIIGLTTHVWLFSLLYEDFFK